MLDRARLKQAFALLGEDLARRQIFVELAVYGASAIILQFDWRRTTEEVNAVVRSGDAESLLQASVFHVARLMNLPPDWLNNAVGMFTPLQEDDAFFAISGTYPAGDNPGLRVLVARPNYLLAMKLHALSSLDRGDKDMADARALASELDVGDVETLRRLYVSFQRAEPRDEIVRQLPSVLERP